MPLAEVARAHGVRGEVRLRVYNQDSDLLLDVPRVRVGERDVEVEDVRRVPGAILMKLGGVDDRDAAAALRGAPVLVRRSDFPALLPGEFYVCDIEGARVVHGGREIGRVARLASYPTVEALVVGDREIPLTDAFVERVDAERGEVVLRELPVE